MKTIQIEQNTNAWLQLRTGGIGASDAPAVMGVSPWTTRFQLWSYKTGLLTPPPAHPIAQAAMKRGHDLEPIAREQYIKKTGIKMEPVVAMHGELEFIRASLDGYNFEQKKILEIKCPGKKDHATAVEGKIPAKYRPQLMQQFLVTGAESADYYSFDGSDGVLISVKPDREYIEQLKKELIAFWGLVQSQTPPEISPKDLTDLVKNLTEPLERLNASFKALSIINGVLSQTLKQAKKESLNVPDNRAKKSRSRAI
jgi:putative phage-type endonuclease